MKKNIISICIIFLLILQPSINYAETFNGYEIIDGIIMDEEAIEKKETLLSEIKFVDPEVIYEDFTDLKDANEQKLERELSDEKLKIEEEEAKSNNRYIVKFKENAVRNISEMEYSVKRALDNGKLKKSQKLQAFEEKSSKLSTEGKSKISLTNDDNKEIKNQNTEIIVNKLNDISIIQIEETVNPEEFIAEIKQDFSDEIEYIQQDFKFELSNTIIMNIESENSELPIEPKILEAQVLTSDEIPEESEEKTDIQPQSLIYD